MEKQIREINKVTVPPRPPYDNPQLRQKIASNGNSTTLYLNGSNLTDQDMGIVADMLETNTVRSNFFFFNIYTLLIL
jgi:hypothetical protein